jgi:hypothetical protein
MSSTESTPKSRSLARKARLDEKLKARKPSSEQRKARTAAYVAAHGEQIAAQRAAAQASSAKRVQQLAVARSRSGAPSRIPPIGVTTPYDIYKFRARAHTASIKERIAAATTKRSVISARSPAHV